MPHRFYVVMGFILNLVMTWNDLEVVRVSSAQRVFEVFHAVGDLIAEGSHVGADA